MRFLVLFAAIILIASNAVAKELDQNQIKSLNNLQHEISNCAMFYNISEEGLKKNGSPDALQMSKLAGNYKDKMMKTALLIGKAISMNQEAIAARFQMSFNMMMDRIEDNFVNYSILLQKHAEPCAKLYKTMWPRFNSEIGG